MTIAATVTIPRACNGPRDSGQGGYSSGALARHVEAEAVEITLRRPVPLGTPLTVAHDGDGDDATVQLLDEGGALVAEGRAAHAGALAIELPAQVTVEQARAAMAGYRGPVDGELCDCYVCGRHRADALGVFAGAVEGREGVVASTWTPQAWTAGADGNVLAEHVWGVLDCPAYFAAYRDAPDPLPVAVLGRFVARLDAPVAVGAEHVVVSWSLAVDGRKRAAASAILTAGGEPLALARALLIEPRSANG